MLDQCFHVLGEKKLRKMLPDELKVTFAQAFTVPLSPRRGNDKERLFKQEIRAWTW